MKIRILSLAALPFFAALAAGSALAAGLHAGEADRISAEVSFLNPAGQTTAGPQGVTYNVGSWSLTEAKVYPPEFYGTHPLYFFGTTMRFNVVLINRTSRGQKSLKVRVEALSHVLETSGLPGQSLAAPQEWVVESLGPGEMRTLRGEVALFDPNVPSGLDITRIRVSHLNEGAEGAALIKEVRAVWCPPPKQ